MSDALPIPKSGGWRHRYAFFLADGSAEDVSAATATIILTHQATGAKLTLALDSGLVLPGASNAVDIDVDRVTKAAWAGGFTTAEICFAWPDGFEEVALVDRLNVHAPGLPSDAGVTNVYRLPDTTRVERVASGPPGTTLSPDTLVAAALLAIRAGVDVSLDDLAKIAAALAQKQAASTALAELAGLAPADGDLIWRNAGHWTTRTLAQLKSLLALDLVNNTADAAKPISTLQQAALDLKLNLAAIDTDPTLAANSNSLVPTQAAVKAYVSALIAAQDVMVFKGVVNCSANPNYPAADCGWSYRVSVAGKIGGGAGINVEAGDILLCTADSTAAGDQATVGAAWEIIQANLDGALVSSAIGVTVMAYNAAVAGIGSLSPTTGNVLSWQSGAWAARTLSQLKADLALDLADNTADASKPVSVLQQAALDLKLNLAALDTDPTLAANSNSRVASQAAVKAYIAAAIAAQDVMVFKGLIDCSANPNYPAADAGWTYRVSVAGKIGGAAGINVEANDMLFCLADGTASGNQATVGASWGIVQANLDGALLTTAIGSTVQAYSSKLGELAAIAAANGDIIQRVAGVWTNQTLTQILSGGGVFGGDITVPINGVSGTPSIKGVGSTSGFNFNSTTSIGIDIAGVEKVRIDGNNFAVATNAFGLGATAAAPDAFIKRVSGNVLAMQNGANGQNFRLYKDFTDASNGSWLEIGYNATNAGYTIGAGKNGSGAYQYLYINIGGTPRWYFGSGSNEFSPNADNICDIGSGPTRCRVVYTYKVAGGTNVGNVSFNGNQVTFDVGANSNNTGGSFVFTNRNNNPTSGAAADWIQSLVTFNPASGASDFRHFRREPTINQTGSATGNVVIDSINLTKTNFLGSTLDFARWQLAGVDKFIVSHLGRVTAAEGIVTTPSTYANLPASPADGQRAFITDCNVAALGNFGAAAAGGGANHVPVYYESGTPAWRIG